MINGFTKEQRNLAASKIMDWGNYMFTGFVIGVLVPGSAPFQWVLFSVGILGMVCAYVMGFLLMREVNKI